MKTYQDLIEVGDGDIARAEFCRQTIREFMGSKDYQIAKAGDSYYNKHNITIEKYKKLIYTVTGNQIEDIFSANYKLQTEIFRRLCIQQVQYVLGNGLILTAEGKAKPDKSKLGKNIDFKLQSAAKKALAQGKAFGFWNLDHLEVFGYADTDKTPGFCPLYDEETAEVRAGIRYWFKKVGNDTIFKSTLYEEDGYTSYSQKNSEEPKVVTPKRAYKITEIKSQAMGVERIESENYAKFPIVVLYANDTEETELSESIRSKIDAYDMIESGLCNTIDDTSGFYWLIKNAGGMDDEDLARLIQRIKTVHAASINAEEGADISAQTFDIPFESRKYILEQLRKDIYEDFQALDVSTLSAAAKTTQEIKAAYQSQDNKCSDFEYYLIDFVQKILELAGVEANPTFRWNKVVNELEQTQMVMQASTYLPDDVVLKHLPFLTPEEVDEILDKLELEEFERFHSGNPANTGAEDNQGDNLPIE